MGDTVGTASTELYIDIYSYTHTHTHTHTHIYIYIPAYQVTFLPSHNIIILVISLEHYGHRCPAIQFQTTGHGKEERIE